MAKVPFESEFELYHYHESLCSQMVRLALEEKAIQWKSHPKPIVAFWWKYRKHPMFERRWGARLVTLMPVPSFLSQKSINTVGKALSNTEAMLRHGGDYLLGDFSQLDIMMTAHFHRLEDVALGSLLTDDRLPKIASYWERLQRRPAYKTAVIDWHEPVWRQALETVFPEQASPALDKIRGVAIA